MKTCTTSLSIRKIATMSYHLTPVRLAIIKTKNSKCWQECREKGTLVHCRWGRKLVSPLWKTVWKFLRKLKKKLPNEPAIPFLGIYPKEMKTPIERDICTPMFNAALFITAKIWKQCKCPFIGEWIKMSHTCTHTHTHTHTETQYEIILSHKKKKSYICNNIAT